MKNKTIAPKKVARQMADNAVQNLGLPARHRKEAISRFKEFLSAALTKARQQKGIGPKKELAMTSHLVFEDRYFIRSVIFMNQVAGTKMNIRLKMTNCTREEFEEFQKIQKAQKQ